MREMILADDEPARQAALDKLLPMQRDDFIEMFRIMAGLPVTIRLLDPPLHEFLPNSDADLAEVAQSSGVDYETLRRRAAQIHEVNPMLGHRGCRLGISYPEIYRMQARAIFEATVAVSAELDETVIPEIMIPLIATPGLMAANRVQQLDRQVEAPSVLGFGDLFELRELGPGCAVNRIGRRFTQREAPRPDLFGHVGQKRCKEAQKDPSASRTRCSRSSGSSWVRRRS